jgi:putrescine transport system permease protein
MSNAAVTAATTSPAADDAKSPLARLGSGFVSRLVIIIPYLWLLLFFLIPFVIVFKISLSQPAIAMPPYTPVLDFSDGISGFFAGFRDLNSIIILADARLLSFKAYLKSLKVAAVATAILLAIGYPLAYGMARAPRRAQSVLVMLVILPFWTSFLIRVYAWIGILKPEGLLNQALLATGIISQPLIILNTYTAIFIGIVYSYLPFMVLPLYSSLGKMDYSLIEAAKDLGCPPTSAFWKITFPLSPTASPPAAFGVHPGSLASLSFLTCSADRRR